MERISIRTMKREEVGKGAARSLRRQDMIPAILYRGGASIPIKFFKKELVHLFNTTVGEQLMVNLQFEDGEVKPALMKDFQVDPIKSDLIHADFFEVSLTENVKVAVHIALLGEPIGVKRDNGILQHILRDIEVECLPDKIPNRFKIDISGLEIGQRFHVGDLQFEEDIKVLTDPEEVIVNILAPVVEEVAPVEEPAPEIAEPEVVKKGKKEEEGEKEKEEVKKEET